jgi:hypothetical protein
LERIKPMKPTLWISLLCGLFVLGAGRSNPPAAAWAAAEPPGRESAVTVRLASGRTFTAELDPRTDANRLWLRWQRGKAAVLRPIHWERVVTAEVGGDELSGEALRRMVERVRQEDPFREEPPPPARVIVVKASAEREPPETPAPQRVAQTPRVHSLAIDATVANWDVDVEVDGLLLSVYPLDAAGRVVPARGTLQVDLTGWRTGVVKRPQPFFNVGRWTRRVKPEDFGAGEATYRLGFGAVHPEFDRKLAPRGALHARLSVPGQGSFEATASSVRIRPYSAVRDELEQATGRRFFPHERVGDGPR